MPGRPNPPKGDETELHMGYFLHELLSLECTEMLLCPFFFLFNVKEYMLFPPHSFPGEWEVWEFSSWRDN